MEPGREGRLLVVAGLDLEARGLLRRLPPGLRRTLSVRTVGLRAARLDRLDPALGITVRQLVDSARAAGLPTEPLVDKALEGASKHAPGARISGAVRGLLEDLGRARGALGSGATEPELVAGAAALRAGLPPEGLGALRRARRDAAVTVPLATLADLVARGVPVETAQDAVLKLARRGEPDEDFVELRQEVERDISAGVPPAARIGRATRDDH